MILETKKKSSSNILFVEDEAGILFVEDKNNDICSFKSVRTVHEVNRHKRINQLIPLNNSLVKAAAWTHNSSVNKLGYTPLQ